MTITINIDRVTGETGGRAYDINLADVPESMLQTAFVYGLRRKINDTVAARKNAERDRIADEKGLDDAARKRFTLPAADVLKIADKTIEDFLAGNLGETNAEAGPRGSSLASHFKKKALKWLQEQKGAVKAAKADLKDGSPDKAEAILTRHIRNRIADAVVVKVVRSHDGDDDFRYTRDEAEADHGGVIDKNLTTVMDSIRKAAQEAFDLERKPVTDDDFDLDLNFESDDEAETEA